jgi:RluA family pseudouridine synthase
MEGASPVKASFTLQILDQGQHHVVVNKPPNMVVVAGRGAPRPTLLDLVTERFGAKVRPVHRLDRGTVGCCLFALDLFGQQALSNAFRRHLVDKRYLAIVEGTPNFTSLNIDARLERQDFPEAKRGPLAHQSISGDGKRALTRVKVLASKNGFAVVDARPETGRMHQIRAHLAHVGHPIVGDKQYGSKNDLDEKRMLLFAYAVSFPEPKKQRRFVVAPLPQLFSDFCGAQDIALKPIYDALCQNFLKPSKR